MAFKPYVHTTASSAGAMMNCPSGHVVGAIKQQLLNDPKLAGDTAHKLAELFLRVKVGKENPEALRGEYERFQQYALHFNRKLEDEAGMYTDYCQSVYDRIKGVDGDALYFVEERVDFDAWKPGEYGFVDFAVVGDNTLEIIDLKTGMQKVSANNNSQLMLYASSMMTRFHIARGITKIVLTIVQPSFPASQRVNSVELTVDELIAYGERYNATIRNKDVDIENVEHCEICNLGATCIHAATYYAKELGYAIERPVESYDLSEVGAMLELLKRAEEYIKEFRDYWDNEAYQRRLDVPGYVMDDKRGRNEYVKNSDAKIVEALAEAYPDHIDMLAPRKPISRGKLEALITEGCVRDVLGSKNLLSYNTFKPKLVPKHRSVDEAVTSQKQEDMMNMLS